MAIWHVAPLRFAPAFRALGVCEHRWLRYNNYSDKICRDHTYIIGTTLSKEKSLGTTLSQEYHTFFGKFRKNISKKIRNFPQFFPHAGTVEQKTWRIEVLLLLMSLSYGADLGRSRLVLLLWWGFRTNETWIYLVIEFLDVVHFKKASKFLPRVYMFQKYFPCKCRFDLIKTQ